MAPRESDQDTIAAIATPPGEGGIGIVRLSGKEAITIAGRMFRAKNGGAVSDQKSFTARYGQVISPGTAAGNWRVVDEVVLLVMRSPNTYTTQDMVEIQTHGGTAVLREVLALAIRHGARLAGHGEFTKRAFLNGRIDLLQAEAVLDLIQAKTEKSLRWAGDQLEGALSRKMSGLKTLLIEILSALGKFSRASKPGTLTDNKREHLLHHYTAAMHLNFHHVFRGIAFGREHHKHNRFIDNRDHLAFSVS